jgi:hypothetical protein
MEDLSFEEAKTAIHSFYEKGAGALCISKEGSRLFGKTGNTVWKILWNILGTWDFLLLSFIQTAQSRLRQQPTRYLSASTVFKKRTIICGEKLLTK